ncbi:hypothetical protein GEV33_006189 [Tenebrio molitor]|uniref:Uncharacterized protein n=1 Tax=Tenebrio molitor TaxID=7067 RepID=A0A8J6HLJ0_TENMO|nr:hypothetical protein GEV33_006189 [Tenebrio molitor]
MKTVILRTHERTKSNTFSDALFRTLTVAPSVDLFRSNPRCRPSPVSGKPRPNFNSKVKHRTTIESINNPERPSDLINQIKTRPIEREAHPCDEQRPSIIAPIAPQTGIARGVTEPETHQIRFKSINGPFRLPKCEHVAVLLCNDGEAEASDWKELVSKRVQRNYSMVYYGDGINKEHLSTTRKFRRRIKKLGAAAAFSTHNTISIKFYQVISRRRRKKASLVASGRPHGTKSPKKFDVDGKVWIVFLGDGTHDPRECRCGTIASQTSKRRRHAYLKQKQLLRTEIVRWFLEIRPVACTRSTMEPRPPITTGSRPSPIMEVQVQPHARTQTAIICVIRLRALSADTEDVRYASSNVLDSAQKKRIIIPVAPPCLCFLLDFFVSKCIINDGKCETTKYTFTMEEIRVEHRTWWMAEEELTPVRVPSIMSNTSIASVRRPSPVCSLIILFDNRSFRAAEKKRLIDEVSLAGLVFMRRKKLSLLMPGIIIKYLSAGKKLRISYIHLIDYVGGVKVVSWGSATSVKIADEPLKLRGFGSFTRSSEGNFMRDELLCLRVLLRASLSITGSPPRSRNLPLFEFQRQYVASDLPPEPDRIICQRESAVEAPSRVLLATNANDCSIRDVSLPLDVQITAHFQLSFIENVIIKRHSPPEERHKNKRGRDPREEVCCRRGLAGITAVIKQSYLRRPDRARKAADRGSPPPPERTTRNRSLLEDPPPENVARNGKLIDKMWQMVLTKRGVYDLCHTHGAPGHSLNGTKHHRNVHKMADYDTVTNTSVTRAATVNPSKKLWIKTRVERLSNFLIWKEKRQQKSKQSWMLFSGIHHFHTNNEQRSGGSKTATTSEIVDNIHNVVLVDRRIKVSEIAEAIRISYEREKLENDSFPTILRELALAPTFDTAAADGVRRSIPPEGMYPGQQINPRNMEQVLKIIALSFEAHCNTPLHVLKNTHQCLRGNSLAFFSNSDFQIINCVDRPEISIDQPIIKKLPQIMKSLPCCIGCSPVLLKIPISHFVIVDLIDENIRNVVPNKQEWQNRAKIQVVGVHTVLKPVPDVTDARSLHSKIIHIHPSKTTVPPGVPTPISDPSTRIDPDPGTNPRRDANIPSDPGITRHNSGDERAAGPDISRGGPRSDPPVPPFSNSLFTQIHKHESAFVHPRIVLN